MILYYPWPAPARVLYSSQKAYQLPHSLICLLSIYIMQQPYVY